MLLLIPAFFFTISIFLTSFFFILLLLHHYRHHCVHLSNSFLSFPWLNPTNWIIEPSKRQPRGNNWIIEPPKHQPRQDSGAVGLDIDTMTLKGATSQACAACKYQRRKCTPECPLAPYFPPDQPKTFQNAHKLFGVCNILKILRCVDPSLKFETMKSIIYQANVREKFPVYGCWEVIWQYQYQIMVAEQELQNVHKQLATYKQHQYQRMSAMPDYVTSQLELAMAPPTNDNNNAMHVLPITQEQQHQQPYSYDIDCKDNISAANALWDQNHFTNNISINDNNNNAEIVESPLGGSMQTLAIEAQDVQEYDELHPFFDTIDRQSYIHSKEAYESSSSEDLYKDTTQSSMENALKNAAPCFNLTSVKLSVS